MYAIHLRGNNKLFLSAAKVTKPGDLFINLKSLELVKEVFISDHDTGVGSNSPVHCTHHGNVFFWNPK